MTGSPPVVVIEARPETVSARLRALWQYRGFYGFLFKEIMNRKSRGTLLGFWWLILRPLIPAVGFIVAFTVVHPVDNGTGVPYPIFFLSGFIPWRVFQSAMVILPRTLNWMQGIMKRTYFPRLLVPLAGFGPTFIELAVLVLVFIAVLAPQIWAGTPLPIRLRWETLWLVPALAAALAFALAIGMVMSVVALFFRDVVFTIPYVVQMIMFVTPVLYPVTVIPDAYQWLLYALNPMAQVIEISRWAITGSGAFHPVYAALSLGTILATLILSTAFFLRAEVHLADRL